MLRRTGTLFALLLAAGFCHAARAQTLELATEVGSSGSVAINVNYSPEGARVVAMQFDLRFKPDRLNATGLQLDRGRSLTAEHGLDYRLIQPGTLRILVIPPIRQQMPPLTGGHIATMRFPGLEKLSLEDSDIRFVPGSVVLSDSGAKTVAIRTTLSNVGKGKARIKK